MDISMVSKLEKAKRYAEERERIHFTGLAVSFDGDNNTHQVSFSGEKWHCDCRFFSTRDWCCHTVAIAKVLEKMVPASEPMPG